MENNFEDMRPDDAASALDALSADRQRLVADFQVPWPLMAAFGGVGAWWVAGAATATPGENYTPPSTGWLGVAAALIIAYLVRRETGIQFRKMGARASWATVGIVLICLTLFSVSLGLVSFGMHWAIAMTSLIAFIATTLLAGYAFRSAAETLARA